MTQRPGILTAYGVLAGLLALGLTFGALAAYCLAQPTLRQPQANAAYIEATGPREGAIALQRQGAELALQSGLATLDPLPVAPKGRKVRAQIRVEGPNAAVLSFIGRVQAAPGQFQLERLIIKRAREDGARLQADLVVAARLRPPPKESRP